MAEQHPHHSTVNIRLRPECVPVPQLAQHINLFLDSQEPGSPFLSAGSGNLSPHGDPFRRILVWGARGVGKNQTLEHIVEAFGPKRALLITGPDLASAAGLSKAVELLRHAKESGELAVLAVSDFDQPVSEGLAPLFGPTGGDCSEDSPSAVPGEDTTEPNVERSEAVSDDLDLGSPSPAESRSAYEAILRTRTGGGDHQSMSRAAISALQRSRTRTKSGGQLGASRLLEAVKTEAVPALVICSTSSYMADLPALAAVKDMFDLVAYAPLPSHARLSSVWEKAVATIPVKDSVDTGELASLSEGFTERDIYAVVRTAIGDTYIAQNRPLEDLVLGQVDLLAPLATKKPFFELWADSADPRHGEPQWMGADMRRKAVQLPAIASDLDRVRRGAETRELLAPEALRQAALGELSALNADGAEGGWDSLLNGGLH